MDSSDRNDNNAVEWTGMNSSDGNDNNAVEWTHQTEINNNAVEWTHQTEMTIMLWNGLIRRK